MGYLKKIICIVLGICMALGLVSQTVLPARAEETEDERPVSQYRWITRREEVDGHNFTADPVLARKLNEIFDGNAGIYRDYDCTSLVNTKLGSYSVPNNGVNMFVGPYGDDQMDMGTSCWIYANGVYCTLFGEGTGCGTAGANSEKLDLSHTAHRNISYDNLQSWGVRPGVGALIRTTSGHSLIVLGYDEERLVILDGNGDGKGLVAIRVITWDRQGFRASYIIQPKQSHMDALYPRA